MGEWLRDRVDDVLIEWRYRRSLVDFLSATVGGFIAPFGFVAWLLGLGYVLEVLLAGS